MADFKQKILGERDIEIRQWDDSDFIVLELGDGAGDNKPGARVFLSVDEAMSIIEALQQAIIRINAQSK